MNKYEKDEINSLPYKYRPMTVGAYIGYGILFGIPLIGFICILIFSFNRGSINRRSYARYWLFVILLVVALIGITVGVLFATGTMDVIIDFVKDYIETLPKLG